VERVETENRPGHGAVGVGIPATVQGAELEDTAAEKDDAARQGKPERHPDVAVYKTPPPARDSSVWSIWVPEIVMEVVSPGGEHRDYVEKAEDYLHFGVGEYWIIDASRGVITVHRRSRGRWQKRELGKSDRYVTHLLPGFELVVATVVPA